MSVSIDFVTFDDERNACLLVLVEKGPWTGSVEEHLKALQEKLYGCLEAALDVLPLTGQQPAQEQPSFIGDSGGQRTCEPGDRCQSDRAFPLH